MFDDCIIVILRYKNILIVINDFQYPEKNIKDSLRNGCLLSASVITRMIINHQNNNQIDYQKSPNRLPKPSPNRLPAVTFDLSMI